MIDLRYLNGKLQYRQRTFTFLRTTESHGSISDIEISDWSNWQDVPHVTEEPKKSIFDELNKINHECDSGSREVFMVLVSEYIEKNFVRREK